MMINRFSTRGMGWRFSLRSRGISKEVVVIEEADQGEANGFEGAEIGEVGLGESVAVLDGFVEKGAAVAAEGHRWKLVNLGA